MLFKTDDTTDQWLRGLQARTGAPDLGTLLKDALNVYDWLVAQQGQGHTIRVHDGETEVAELASMWAEGMLPGAPPEEPA
jgi:hypothetical protein